YVWILHHLISNYIIPLHETLWDEFGHRIRQENQRGVTLDLSSLAPGAYGAVQGSQRWLNRLIVNPK
ncbi:MAG: hypothetical protein OTI34_15250, partial [Lewinella sp.]|nr:hypothetical protein [Lewinella sp.]